MLGQVVEGNPGRHGQHPGPQYKKFFHLASDKFDLPEEAEGNRRVRAVVRWLQAQERD